MKRFLVACSLFVSVSAIASGPAGGLVSPNISSYGGTSSSGNTTNLNWNQITNAPAFLAAGAGTYRGIVASRASSMGWFEGTDTSSKTSNGTDTNGLFSIDAVVTANCANPAPVFINSAEGTNYGKNPIYVQCAIYNQRLNVTNVFTFGGQPGVWIQPGVNEVQADPWPVNWKKGDFIREITLVSCAAGGVWFEGPVTQFADEGTLANIAPANFAITNINAGLGNAFAPAMILGDLPAGTPTIAVIGDSLVSDFQQFYENSNQFVVYDWSPYFEFMANTNVGSTNIGSGFGHINLGLQGDQSAIYAGAQSALCRKLLSSTCTYIWYELGANDLLNGTNVLWTNLLNQINYYTQQGKRIIIGSVVPHGVTGSYTSTNGQIINASWETNRVWLNNVERYTFGPWAASNAYSNVSFVDTAEAVETFTNSGFWIPYYTSDGLHWSNTVAYQAVSNYFVQYALPVITNYYSPNFSPVLPPLATVQQLATTTTNIFGTVSISHAPGVANFYGINGTVVNSANYCGFSLPPGTYTIPYVSLSLFSPAWPTTNIVLYAQTNGVPFWSVYLGTNFNSFDTVYTIPLNSPSNSFVISSLLTNTVFVWGYTNNPYNSSDSGATIQFPLETP